MNSNIIPKTNLPSGAWRVVVLLFFVGCLNYLDRTMITTMRGSIMEEIPMTEAQFGLLTSVFLWIYGLFSPFSGFLADRFNRSRVIIGSLFLWSFVTWLTSFATTFEELLITRALMGISEACYIPAALALIVDYHKGPTRSLASGINLVGIMVGASLGFVGSWIAEESDWSMGFSIFGGVGVIYSGLLLFFLKDAPKDNNSPVSDTPVVRINFFEAIKNLLSQSSFILIVISWTLLGLVGWILVGWLPTYYKEHFNLSQTVAGIYATGYLFPASLIGVLLGGVLADRWISSNQRAPILVSVIGLCIGAPCIYFASNTTILYLANIFFMVYSLTKVFTETNMMPILCLVVDSRYRATGFGILNLFACVVGGIGIYAGGALRDAQFDLSVIFQFASLLLGICALLLYMVKIKPLIIVQKLETQKFF